MTYTLGIDVSGWQGTMNWGVAASAGAKFAYLRAGSINNNTGNPYTDRTFPYNVATAPDYMICGAYWYFRPNWSAMIQADYISDLVAGQELYLPLWCDVESSGGLDQNAVAEAVQAFVQRYFANTGKVAAIYTRATFWNPSVGNPAFAADLDLAVARYNEVVDHPWNDNPTLLRPEPWQDFKFWQWSADGNMRGAEFGAESNSIDLDRFNGDYDALLAYAGLEPGSTLEERVARLEEFVNYVTGWEI